MIVCVIGDLIGVYAHLGISAAALHEALRLSHLSLAHAAPQVEPRVAALP